MILPPLVVKLLIPELNSGQSLEGPDYFLLVPKFRGSILDPPTPPRKVM